MFRFAHPYDRDYWKTSNKTEHVCWLRLRAPAPARLMVINYFDALTCSAQSSVAFYDPEDEAQTLDSSQAASESPSPSAVWTGCEREGDSGWSAFFVSSSSSLLIAVRLANVETSYEVEFAASVVQVSTNYSLLVSSVSSTVGESLSLSLSLSCI